MIDLPEWMTSKEVAALYRVHISTVQRWVKKGKLPVTRPGGRVIRIRREDVLALAGVKDEPKGRPAKPAPTTEELEASAKAAQAALRTIRMTDKQLQAVRESIKRGEYPVKGLPGTTAEDIDAAREELEHRGHLLMGEGE